jgi:16S rRNA (uracil1498-N3)-methyltransferase
VVLILVSPGHATPGRTIPLEDDEQHHLRVRRIGAGTEVGFVDGDGGRGTGRLTGSGKVLRLDVTAFEQLPRPVPLVLAVGAGDRDRMGWLVEKATELGVTDLVPLESERTLGVATRLKASHLEGLQRRSREALKQCGSAWVTKVHEVESISVFVPRCNTGARWMLDADGGPADLLDSKTPLTALVGPEGGLVPAERQLALENGFRPVCAAPHTMRFETAAVAAAVLAQSSRR